MSIPLRRLATHPAAPWIAYALSRALLVFAYDEYLSDVRHYAEWAARAWGGGEHAYADFRFPYPPLALALVYLPRLGGVGYESYRSLFRLEMLLLDLACLFLLTRIADSRLGLDRARRGWAVVLYSLLALPLGHVIYDRLDLAIAACFLAVLLSSPPDRLAVPREGAAGATRSLREDLPGSLWSGAGILVKVVPLFWLPWLWTFSWLGRRRVRAWDVLLGLAIALGPAAAVILAWDWSVGGALGAALLAHLERGIQIESTWASPLWIAALAGAGPALAIEYGAHHFAEAEVPRAYGAASRLAGFALMAIVILTLGLRLRRSGSPESHRPDRWRTFFHAGTALFLLLLATQPLLSPQFFVWLLPALCLHLAAGGRWWEHVMVGLIYVLTWVEFDLGYLALLRGEPAAIAALLLRNAVLVTFSASMTWALLTRRRGAAEG